MNQARGVLKVSFFSGILTSLFERAPMLRGAMTDDDKPIEVLCRDLLSSRGEVSGMSLAQLILIVMQILMRIKSWPYLSYWQMRWMYHVVMYSGASNL